MRRTFVAGALAALAALLAGGCAAGPPPGFSDGEQWVVPLIGPVEDQLLLVPALVNDKGPFVFAIDPDAPVSVIDEDVLNSTGAHTGEGPRLLDESDTQRTRFYAEILAWQLGTLTVKGPMPAEVVGKGTFDRDGRRIHGVIGRDIVADSLVFGFDRDAGVVTLTTQKGFAAPAQAISFKYSKLHSSIQNVETLPLPRRLVDATIGGATFSMHVDLGASHSQLRQRSWARARLGESPVDLAVVDEVGMLRRVSSRGMAAAVTVGGATAKNVAFVPFVDRRWPDQDIEGALGLDFFRPYAVTVNWDSEKLYLTSRKDPTLGVATRIARWQSKTLTSCKQPGCVKISAVDPLAGQPPPVPPAKHPGIVLSAIREPEAQQLELEVLIAVAPADGKAPLKWLVANLPAGSERAMTHLPADYVGASYTVLDAGLFPRACPAEGGCIDRIEPPEKLASAGSRPAP